ncbi:MAG: hypothetical protein JW822_09400 [Spirochaetales bacterium]|nr:hypothetical protein [Spirochaetales bacterium]
MKKIQVVLAFMCIIMILSVLTACPAPGGGGSHYTLTQIDVSLVVGANDTGTFTIELRDAAGSVPALWSTTVNTNIFVTGSSWNSFTVPDIKLTEGQTYRIYMTRSDVHDNPGGNTISWNSTNTVGDEYPQGISSSPATVDFTFRIYDHGVVDQQLETTETAYAVHQGSYNWQEFVPGS